MLSRKRRSNLTVGILILVLILLLGAYFLLKPKISADTTTTPNFKKTISVALNNYNMDGSSHLTYHQIIPKLTPQKAGWRCKGFNITVKLPVNDSDLSVTQILKNTEYKDKIFDNFSEENSGLSDMQFLTQEQHARYTTTCSDYVKVNPNDNNMMANDSCRFMVNSVIKESLKETCSGPSSYPYDSTINPITEIDLTSTTTGTPPVDTEDQRDGDVNDEAPPGQSTESPPDTTGSETVGEGPEQLPVPIGGTAEGQFPEGESNINIRALRYSEAGTVNDKYTPVGGVELEIKYYEQDDIQTGLIATIGGFLSRRPTIRVRIPDNGVNSRLMITKLPLGNYEITAKKNNYQNKSINHSITPDGSNNIVLVLEPQPKAEPPSINGQVLTSSENQGIYLATMGGRTFAYNSNAPRQGWLPTSDNLDGNVSRSGLPSNGEPPSNMQSTLSADRLRTYWQAIRTGSIPNMGNNIKPETAAISAGIMGLANFLSGSSGTRNTENFLESVLLPGLTTYYSARAMNRTGTSIDFRTIDGPNQPWNDPYLQNYPSECSGCFALSAAGPHPYCPPYCRQFMNPIGQLLTLPRF